MDADSFRWLATGAFATIAAMLGVIWKSLDKKMGDMADDMSKVKEAVTRDIVDLRERVTWVEAHSPGGAHRRRASDFVDFNERTGGGMS